MVTIAVSPEPQDSSDRDVQLIISVVGMAAIIVLILVALYVIAMIILDPNALRA